MVLYASAWFREGRGRRAMSRRTITRARRRSRASFVGTAPPTVDRWRRAVPTPTLGPGGGERSADGARGGVGGRSADPLCAGGGERRTRISRGARVGRRTADEGRRARADVREVVSKPGRSRGERSCEGGGRDFVLKKMTLRTKPKGTIRRIESRIQHSHAGRFPIYLRNEGVRSP